MEMNTELVCVIASLGYNDGDEYFKSHDCLESLRDIIRFLRHEDLQICNIRRQLGYSKLLQNDLIPLLVSNPDDKEISDIVLRLLVNLTSAPHLCFEQNPIEEDTNDSTERKSHELELTSYLQSYKEAFTQKSAMSAVSSRLATVLQKDVSDRDEDDDLLLERILLLIRNILYVPADPDDEKRTDDDVTIHDQLLWSLHENGVDDLLIYISSSEDERNWCMHVCEIISHMFREQNAEELAKASEFRSIKEKEEDTNTLKAILEREREEKAKVVQDRGARHSRFGGAFWVKDQKALNKEQDLVYHRTLQSAKDMSHDFDKMPEKKRKTKIAITEINLERKSTLSVRLFLKDFCIKFIQHGYNNLLSAVKSSIESGKTQKNDESFYLAVMRFFMTFNRVYDFKVEYVSQTIGVQVFSDILKLIMKYDDQYDIIKPTKGKDSKIQFSRRIHLALRAYKELLMYVAVMMKTQDENLFAVAEVIQSNIFYVEEYRNVFLTLLRHWSPAFQTRAHLKDVIEAFHLYLKLFESFLKVKGTFLTRTKKVKKKVRVPKKKAVARCPIEISEEQLENLWQNEVSVVLSARIQGRDGGIPDDIITPFDPTSDAPNNEQILSALATIQRLLRCKQPGEAIAFLRASRECWPGESNFGTRNMSGEEEFMCARAIFFMKLPPKIVQNAEDQLKSAEIEETQEETIEEEVEEESRVVKKGEKVFELKQFLKMLARPYVVEPYCYLLKTYDTNKAYTNHCIIKMLTRIALDLEMFPMLFQLSLFVTFKKILHEPKTDSNKEMRGFAKFILAKFFDVYKTNRMVVIELLFWKNNTECYEIVEGYGTLDVKRGEKTNSEVGRWNFEEEQELLDLYDELKDEDDVVEKIAERLSEKGRTSKQIRNKLVRLRRLEKPKKRKANEWTEEETEELRNLFEEFKATDEPLTNIMNAMTFKKGKKWIISRLLELGLIENRKELHAKRKKKKKNLNEDGEEDEGLIIDENAENGFDEEGQNGESSDEDEEDEDDDEDDEDFQSNSTLSQMLQKLVDLGFQNEVDWIRGRLTRLGNEREAADEDDWQSVPLVPITEDHEKALSSKLFKQMLKRIGISPPSNEQEAFWRISSSLSPSEIQAFTDELANASKRKSSVPNQKKNERKSKESFESQRIKYVNNQEEESDDDIFERFVSGNRLNPVRNDFASGDLEANPEDADEIVNNGRDINDGAGDESSNDGNERNGIENGNRNKDSSRTSPPPSLLSGKRTRGTAFEDDGDDEIANGMEEGLKRKDKRRKRINDEDDDNDDDGIKMFDKKGAKDDDENEINDLVVGTEDDDDVNKGKEILNDSDDIVDYNSGEEENKVDNVADENMYEVNKSMNDKDEHEADEEIIDNNCDNSFVLEMSIDEGHDE